MNNESNRMYMEQSHKNNTPTARFYNQVIDTLGGMSPAKKDGYHDAIDGFPCIVYYNEGGVDADGKPAENILVGSFMFNIDKEGKELGFECDLYDEIGDVVGSGKNSCISYEATANASDTAGCFYKLSESIVNVYNYYLEDSYKEYLEKYKNKTEGELRRAMRESDDETERIAIDKLYKEMISEDKNIIKTINKEEKTFKPRAIGAKSFEEHGVAFADKATNERDKEQRFMGDRYFYAADTGKGKVLAIFADGENGIWTVMEEGYSHIEMLDMNGTEKAEALNEQTWKYIARRGMVSNAYFEEGAWKPEESDNDGLWTSMYAGGELMRYAVLKNDPNATPEQIEEARKTATLSTEAVLFLTYISMRQGTVESYNRAQRSGTVVDLETGKYYTSEATLVGGDYSQNIPFESPAEMFEKMNTTYMESGKRTYLQLPEENLKIFNKDGWANPAETEGDYAMRTRNLEGFWSRTYSFRDENNDYDSFAYWSHNGDGTATGLSTKTYGDGSDFLLHGENYRGLKVDATGEIPERLWKDLIPEGRVIEDIVYKGDTSSDEIIGHVFLYKLAYDILGPEDPELAALIANTMNKFAQHLVDNSYNMVDGSGQPTTWAKFSRTYFHNGQVLGGAPLNALVLLSVFKVAAHVTGYQKWEDEYRMAAFDEQYQYAEIMTQELERYHLSILEYVNSVSPVLGFVIRPLVGTEVYDTLYRLILNHSDEEMAMLAFYTLFQLIFIFFFCFNYLNPCLYIFLHTFSIYFIA